MEKTPVAKAYLLVVLRNFVRLDVWYLGLKSGLGVSMCMGNIAKPFVVSIIHHVAYWYCVNEMNPAGQSAGRGISSLSDSCFPWHCSTVKDVNGQVSRR